MQFFLTDALLYLTIYLGFVRLYVQEHKLKMDDTFKSHHEAIDKLNHEIFLLEVRFSMSTLFLWASCQTYPLFLLFWCPVSARIADAHAHAIQVPGQFVSLAGLTLIPPRSPLFGLLSLPVALFKSAKCVISSCIIAK